MIEVIYDGNLGNNLFQYCFGRILAESLGYKLRANPIPGFPGTCEVIDGKDYSGKTVRLLRGQKPDLTFMKECEPKYHILLTGYFQRYEYYKKYRSIIKEWLRIDYKIENLEIDKKDVVIGVRRGRDYIPRHGLPLSYYIEAIELAQPRRVYICTDIPSDPFVKSLKNHYSATVRMPNALDNMLFITRFNNIVISNSTFLWWGAFLSDAEQIIFPRPSNGFWSRADIMSKNIALEIDDPACLYLECEKYQSEFVSEKIANLCDDTKRSIKDFLRELPLLQQMRRAPQLPKYLFAEDNDSEDSK